MKRTVLALLAATLAPAAFAAGGYSEMWNPPEARATAPHRVRAAHKLAVHRHVVAHAVKVRTQRVPMPAPKLVAKQRNIQKGLPASEPDMSEIPRQLTPEGNVLRVDSRGISAEVIRSHDSLKSGHHEIFSFRTHKSEVNIVVQHVEQLTARSRPFN